jgi:hypothetical protein
MVCTCVDELKRLLSGGSCTNTDDLELRHATGVFNLVCTLHAAADKFEAERVRGLCDWLATTWERFFLLLGRRSPLRDYPRAEIWQVRRR